MFLFIVYVKSIANLMAFCLLKVLLNILMNMKRNVANTLWINWIDDELRGIIRMP